MLCIATCTGLFTRCWACSHIFVWVQDELGHCFVGVRQVQSHSVGVGQAGVILSYMWSLAGCEARCNPLSVSFVGKISRNDGTHTMLIAHYKLVYCTPTHKSLQRLLH